MKTRNVLGRLRLGLRLRVSRLFHGRAQAPKLLAVLTTLCVVAQLAFLLVGERGDKDGVLQMGTLAEAPLMPDNLFFDNPTPLVDRQETAQSPVPSSIPPEVRGEDRDTGRLATVPASPAKNRVRHVEAFSLNEADVVTTGWPAALVDAVPAAVRRAGHGEVHAVQREMLPYVADMLDHALHSYFTHAFPHDDLLPLTGGCGDSFGGVGITLLDSLDTLALAGRHRTFRRAARWVEEHLALATQDAAVSAFEVNIRAVGGLLAAHYVYEEGVVPVVRGEHDYGGGLLRRARELSERVMRVFDSPTGLPFPLINLQRGTASTEQTVTTNADAGSFLLEFAALSRLTGNATYEYAARRAAQILHDMREPATQLMNMFLDVVSGKWTDYRRTGIGSCIDSTIEYAVKHHVLSGEVQEWREYETDRRASSAWLRQGGFYYELSHTNTMQLKTVTQGLSAFYPGNMVLGGHHAEAAEGVWAVHGLVKRSGTLAEETELQRGDASVPRYQLRPEHAESLYYLYRATHDPAYLAMGREVVVGLQLHTRVPYGFAVLSENGRGYSRRHLGDYMESFMIAETLKYLYLLFDEASVVHGGGGAAGVGWVFTTEAHVVPNTWEQWGLDAATVRTGLRTAPVRSAYTAYMFNTSASRLESGETPVQAAEGDLVAEAAVVRDRWLFRTGLGRVDPLLSAGWTEEQQKNRVQIAWERLGDRIYRRQRGVYRRRRTHFTEPLTAARRRHVLGMLCAVYGRLRRVRGGDAAGRVHATALGPLMRELRSVCVGCGPELRTPLFTLPSAPFTNGAVVNAVHRRYSDAVGGGAYGYFCDVAHLRGVRHLSRGVYHPAVPFDAY
jgi:ER degradation enhancer, mannosidase alpha-like 2